MAGVRSDGRKRREDILDAALECFSKHGVVATRIEDIRKRAKASPSSVYHLFGGIEEIMLALLERTFERLFGHLGEHVLKTRTAEAAVTALVEAQIDWVLANRAEARVMYQAMSLETSPRVTTALAKRKAELLGPLASHFGRFIVKGTLPRWSPLVVDVVVLGTTHEACRRFLGGAALDPTWMRASLPKLAWSAVRAAR